MHELWAGMGFLVNLGSFVPSVGKPLLEEGDVQSVCHLAYIVACCWFRSDCILLCDELWYQFERKRSFDSDNTIDDGLKIQAEHIKTLLVA